MSEHTVPDPTPVDVTAIVATARALLADGWRYDSTTPMSDGTTIRTLLHSSGREITAQTYQDGSTTRLTLDKLSATQAVSAIRGAGLVPEPEQAADAPEAAPEPAIGDVGKCPSCGTQSRSYSRGCSYCGYGRPAVTPAPEATPEPEYWSSLAAELHQVAEQLATLAGSDTPAPWYVNLSINSVPTPAEADRGVPIADAIAAALGMTAAPGHLGGGMWHHQAQREQGGLTLAVRSRIPAPESAEVTALRAEVERLRSQIGGAR